MNKNYKLIDKEINEIKDLIELKQFLNKTFDNQNNTKEKETFLDYLELDYLFNKKVRFEADKIKIDQLKTNFFIHFYLQAKHKIEFIEKWIIEKRKETLEKQPEPKFNEKIPTKNLDEFKGKCEGIYWNLKFNSKDKSKMFKIINENSEYLYLSSYLAVQEIKRLHHSERKEFAKYYLDYVKKYKNHTNEFLNDLITKSVLIPFDLNQFNIAVFIHFDFFIDEVERLTGLSESKLHPQKETGKEIFDPKIFQDQRSFDLFLFLVEEYATTKQPKQFSQIFHWMQENDNSIKPNTGVKFREFVVKRFPEMVAKFSRIEEKKTYEMTTLNGKLKEFNSLNKV